MNPAHAPSHPVLKSRPGRGRKSSVFAVAMGVAIATGCANEAPPSQGRLGAGEGALPVGFNLTGTTVGEVDRLKASLPVAATSGLVTQTVEASWDEGLKRLSAPPTVPQNWTLEYYANGTKLAQTPVTPTQWDVVDKLRAFGTYTSQGAEGGRQVIINTIEAPRPIVAGAFQGQSTGDGWNAFFDPEYTRVFNIHHHSGPASVMCRKLSDSTPCSESWPVSLASGRTNVRSGGIIDPVTHYIWSPTNVDGYIGWDCVDANAGTVCETPTFATNLVVRQNDNWSGSNSHGEIIQKGRRIYSLAFTEFDVRVMCFDLDTLEQCPGAILESGGRFEDAGLDIVGDRVYALAGRSAKLECFKTDTVVSGKLAKCGGNWPVQTASTGRVLGVPSSDGVVRSVCADWQCYTLEGVEITAENAGPLTLPPNYVAYRPLHPASALGSPSPDYSGSSRVGPKVVWSCDGSSVCCWDLAVDQKCSPEFPVTVPSLYASILDPYDDNCVWSNGDDGVIRNYRIDDPYGEPVINEWGEESRDYNGCAGGDPKIQFKASISIPRLGCDESTRVFEYRHIKVIEPSSERFTSATMTIKDSNGVEIPGWVNVAIPSTGLIDLSELTVAEAGTTPVFDIKPVGLVTTEFVPKVEVKVVTGSPSEVCFELGPRRSDCFDAAGAAIAGNTSATNITALATNRIADGAETVYPTQTYATTGHPPSPTFDRCGGGFVKGRVTQYTSSPVAGAAIQLLYESGEPVLNPNTSLPLTTTSAADGTFSFPVWGGFSYRVRHVGGALGTPIYARVITGGDGIATPVAGTITSPHMTPPSGGISEVEIVLWKVVGDLTLVGESEAGVDCFVATLPAESAVATITQSIDLQWDSSLRQLHDLPTLPQGWDISYYSGNQKLDSTPTSTAAWASVSRVVAEGTYVSQGIDESGRQVIRSVIDAPPPTVAEAFSGNSSGDGWNVIFDPNYDRVYNIHHHNGPPTVMCRKLSDSQPCNDSYPIGLTQTSNRSRGVIDPNTYTLWSPTVGFDNRIGWDCVDLALSERCENHPTVWSEFYSVGSNHDYHMEVATIGRRLYSLGYSSNGRTRITCLDMSTGTECKGVQLQGNTSTDSSGLDSVGSRLYALAGGGQVLECFDTTNPDENGAPSPCGGNWPVQTSSTGRVLGTPSADGVVRSVCADWECFTLDGTPITSSNAGPATLPPNYLAYHPSHRAGALGVNYPQYSGATRFGPRVAWTCDESRVCCWDMSSDSACSAAFPIEPMNQWGGRSTYAPTFDPEDDNCIWTNGDDGVIRNYRIDTGVQGCAGGPPKIQFKASVAVPRLGCNAESRVFEYRTFRLITPAVADYDSAKLTIKDSNGVSIVGWTNIPIPENQTIDISALPVSVAGTTPTFNISAEGLDNFAILPRAELVVVSGGPPQVCWCLNPPSDQCPANNADVARNPPPSGIVDTLVTANGTYSDSNGLTRNYSPREYATQGENAQPPIDECSGSFDGIAFEVGTEAVVAGVPVTLGDKMGRPIINPITNLPMTTLTDESGHFSFSGIWGGASYTVTVGQSAYLDPVAVFTRDDEYPATGDRYKITSHPARVPHGDRTTAKIEMDGWQIRVDQQEGGIVNCPRTARTASTFSCEAIPNEGMALSEMYDNYSNSSVRISGQSYLSLPVYENHIIRPVFRKTNGTGCETNFDCASGFCIEGICCNTACSGKCEACDVEGSVGTCTSDVTPAGNGLPDNTCNGVDDNCSGQADEGYAPITTTCGVGACVNTTGFSTCIGGFEDRFVGTCDPKTNANYREVESCNNVDDNCNGSVDEGVGSASVCAVPETNITSSPNNPTASTTATFAYFDPNSPANLNFECSIDAGAWTPCNGTGAGGGQFTYENLSAGTHIFQVRSVLNAALKDSTPAFYTWTIDLSKPDTFVVSGPQNPSQTTTATFVFGANISNPKAYYCSLDPVGAAPNEAEWVACDVSETFESLAEGDHTIWVYVVNQAGVADDTPAVYSWVIDTTAPDTTITDTFGGQCICPAGYSPSPGGDGCFWQEEAPALLSQTVYEVCAGDTNGSYTQHGTRFSTSLNAADFEVPEGGNASATCTNPAVCLSESELDVGYLNEVGVWACDAEPLNTYIGFSTCLSLPEGGEFLVGIAGDNRVMMRLDGQTVYESVSSLNFRSWNVLRINVSSGEHILELFGQNFGGVVSFGAEIWGPFPAGSLATPAAMRDAYIAAKDAEGQLKLVFSTRNLRDSESGITFDSSLDGASGYSCPENFALDRCGSDVPTCVKRDETDCAFEDCSNDRTLRFSSYTDEVATRFVCRLDSGDWKPCDAGSVTYTELSEGTHTVQVAAIDENGNIDPTPATATFVVDTVEPETTIDLAPLDPSQSDEAAFVFSSNEDGSTYFCKLDDAAEYLPCTSPIVYRELNDGPHMFSVYAADKGCKVDSTPAVHKWTIDTTFPETVFITTPPVLNGSDDDNDFSYQDPTDPEVTTFECKLDDGEWTECDGISNLGVLPVGTHTYIVRACIEVREGLVKCDPTPATYAWEVTTSTCPLDGVSPEIFCAEDFKVECDNGVGLVDINALTPTATDACEPVEVTHDGQSSYPVGTSPIIFTATDGNDNASICVTQVTVQDTQPPVLECGDAQVVEADPGVCGALATITATAKDGCDTEGVTILGPSGTIDTPTFFGPGESTVVLTAVDGVGNKATCETKVSVVGIDPLEVLCAAELVVDAPADFCGYPEALVADVKDVCAPVVSLKSASESFPIGDTSVTFEASNDRGESDSCTTKLRVRDVTAPAITCGLTPDLQKLPAAFAPTTSDVCSATLTVSEVGCFQVNTSGTVEVKEGCEVAVRDGTVVAVTALPVRNADGEVIAAEDLRVQWKVSAKDPSGNESTLDCSTAIDLSDRDRDRDGVVDTADNCADIPNEAQADIDLDGIGDICDEAPFEEIKAKGFGGCASGSFTGGIAMLLGLLALVALRKRAVR